MSPAHDHIDRLDPDITGLVLVDVQRAFASADSPIAYRGVDMSPAIETLPRLKALLALARDAGLTVAFTRSVRRADGRDAPERVYDILPTVYRDSDPICLAGNPDAEYVDGVDPLPEEYEVTKRGYDAFYGTPLETYLRTEDVDTLLFCGFSTVTCVESTMRGAFERGFNVVMVEDCCASLSGGHDQTVANVERVLGATATKDQVATLLS